MTKHLTLLLFIGLSWGKSLKLVNTDGQLVIIKPSTFNLQGQHSRGLLYLNGTKYVLKEVDYESKIVKVKRGHNTYSQMFYYFKNEEISFDSIHSFRYVERRFSIIPILIGGGIGVQFFSTGDTASFFFGTIPAFTFGLGLSLLPKFSEELFLSNDGWSISDE
tara:strand:+ start:1795 stop:2283 length:489 start_codon:yes stop_codon:yes gene_type:complete